MSLVDRREFLKRSGLLVGGAAASLLLTEPSKAMAARFLDSEEDFRPVVSVLAKGPKGEEWFKALADTGANLGRLPTSVAEKIGFMVTQRWTVNGVPNVKVGGLSNLEIEYRYSDEDGNEQKNYDKRPLGLFYVSDVDIFHDGDAYGSIPASILTEERIKQLFALLRLGQPPVLAETYRQIGNDRRPYVSVLARGPKGEEWFEALYDTGSIKSVMPKSVAEKIGFVPNLMTNWKKPEPYGYLDAGIQYSWGVDIHQQVPFVVREDITIDNYRNAKVGVTLMGKQRVDQLSMPESAFRLN